MTRELAAVSDYDGLIEALRARVRDLGLTVLGVDELTGLPSGYTGKLLGPEQIKKLGPMSLGLILQALGTRLVLVEDDAMTAKMRDRYAQRERAMLAAPSMRRKIPVKSSRKLAEMRRKRWANTPAHERSNHARRMAKSRWKKWRQNRRGAGSRRTDSRPLKSKQKGIG